MTDPIVDYFRCPGEFANFPRLAALSEKTGFFRFGEEICYGRCAAGKPSARPTGELYDCTAAIETTSALGGSPFDTVEVVDNLRCERYTPGYADSERLALFNRFVRRAYYLVRPALPVSVRKHLQKLHLRTWNKVQFPHWPVDFTVDRIIEKLVLLELKRKRVETMPFIWFWPEGMSSTAIMTHDVETKAGRDFCTTLMNMDDAFGVKSSFQIIPEVRYPVSRAFLDEIKTRGFEVNVHDLNHDGHLFQERAEFMRRAAKINDYLREWGACGFRSAIMYRNQDWLEALDVAYDMSVPNAAHLDPQRGGCCTVMPYFVGKMVEIPLTTTQDYMLLHLLNDYSLDLWRTQTEMVLKKNGLATFLVHPDYVIDQKARDLYRGLLTLLVELKHSRKLWFALPGKIDQWWRARSKMWMERDGDKWRIRGEGAKHAKTAFAVVTDEGLRYDVED